MKALNTLFILLLAPVLAAMAQAPTSENRDSEIVNNETIFTIVEQSAEFPGGMSGIVNFISKEINYPKDSSVQSVSGKVFVQFVIKSDGSIDKESVNILKGLHPLLDSESVRVIRLMPNWQPGRQNGKAVNCRFVLPIAFKAQEPKDDKVFTLVEQPAEYPGGMAALYNFIQKNIQYPKDAKKQGIEGKVQVQFIVTKDGSIDRETIQVVKSLFPSCDAEAIRLVSLFPSWTPGYQNGVAIKSRFVIPIQFKR